MAAHIVEITEAFHKNRSLSRLGVKLFAEGADRQGILEFARNPLIQGVVTDLSLLRKAGVTRYEEFARGILASVCDKPVCWPVCSDDFSEMIRHARIIHSWGPNVYVSIPATNANGDGTFAVIQQLSEWGIRVNVTALVTVEQIRRAGRCLSTETPAILSILAGHIMDAGFEPAFTIQAAQKALGDMPHVDLLWGDLHGVRDIYDAEGADCDIVAVPHDILRRAFRTIASDLKHAGVEAVRRLNSEARLAGYTI